jgi:hypothetical protein
MNEIKISAGGTTYRLTDINNGNKYTRAKTDAGEGASIEKVLAHYDKLGGYIQDKNHEKIDNGKFWAAEKAVISNEKAQLKNMSDEDLEVILRRGENMNVPGSLFQLAKLEIELRDRKRTDELKSVAPRWWETTPFQIIMLLSALAGIVGLFIAL